jgi:hypothetical protein
MCLRSIDKTITPHEFGYKTVRRVEPGKFESSVLSVPYTFRKWYSARDGNGHIPETKALEGGLYDAGFHYYLKEKDAVLGAGIEDIVVKIKVKNILHTGEDNSFPVGVSENIMLLKITAEARGEASFSKKKSIANSLTQSDVEKFVLKKGRQYKGGSVSQDEVDKIVDFVSKDSNSFGRWIVFIDSFSRGSNVFKYATKIHIIMFNKKHTDYWKYYEDIVSQKDKELINSVNKGPLSKSMNGHFDLY